MDLQLRDKCSLVTGGSGIALTWRKLQDEQEACANPFRRGGAELVGKMDPYGQ